MPPLKMVDKPKWMKQIQVFKTLRARFIGIYCWLTKFADFLIFGYNQFFSDSEEDEDYERADLDAMEEYMMKRSYF